MVVLAVALGASSSATLAAPTATTTGVVIVNTRLAYGGGAGAATGIVLTSSGTVLTNNHVIRGADAIRVTVPSTGRAYTPRSPATACRRTSRCSSCVTRAPWTVQTGNSSTVRVGDRVVAVGNGGGGD